MSEKQTSPQVEGKTTPTRDSNTKLENEIDTDSVSTVTLKESASLKSLKNEISGYMRRNDSSAFRFYPGIERNQYNFQDERNKTESTNLIESTAHLIKGSLGVGVLSMHEAYMYAGLWSSLIGTLIIGCFNYYTMKMLVTSAQLMYQRLRVTELTYPGLAEAAASTGPLLYLRKHSKLCRYTVDVCLVLEMCMSCSVYQMVIAHTLKQILHYYIADIFEDIRIYILIVTPLLVLFCMIRSLKILARFSLLSDILLGMCVVTTLYYSIKTEKNITERPIWKDLHGFCMFFGICLYCSCGITIALPVENNMKSPRLFHIVLQLSVPLVTSFVSATGFFGYWGWGEECQSPITVHLPNNEYTTVLQSLLLLMLWTTFAIEFYVPFRIMWYYLRRNIVSDKLGWERLFRLLFIFVITSLSVSFPYVVYVMVFVGNFWLGIINFIFPAIIEYLVTDQDDRFNNIAWRRNKNICFVALGITCCVAAVVVLATKNQYIT